MNSINIHITESQSKIIVNGTEIHDVMAYEVKQDGDHWGAHVHLDFIADGDIDVNISQKASPQ